MLIIKVKVYNIFYIKLKKYIIIKTFNFLKALKIIN